MRGRNAILSLAGFVSLAVAPLAPWRAAPTMAAAGDPDLPEVARSIGRIVIKAGGQGHCSGTLIDRKTVLTAGHCVMRPDTWRPRDVAGMAFELAGRRLPVAQVELGPASPFGPGGMVSQPRHDWALLTLAAPAPADARPLPRAAEGAAQAARITEERLVKAGLARTGPAPEGPTADGTARLEDGKAYKLARTRDCRIDEVTPDGRVLSFRCASGLGEGQSGSAILVPGAAGWKVLGVQTAVATRGPVKFGLAVIPPP